MKETLGTTRDCIEGGECSFPGGFAQSSEVERTVCFPKGAALPLRLL